MDPTFNDLFANLVYRKCFAEVVRNKSSQSEYDEHLSQCAQNYVKAYSVVGNAIGDFFDAEPARDRYGAPKE